MRIIRPASARYIESLRAIGPWFHTTTYVCGHTYREHVSVRPSLEQHSRGLCPHCYTSGRRPLPEGAR